MSKNGQKPIKANICPAFMHHWSANMQYGELIFSTITVVRCIQELLPIYLYLAKNVCQQQTFTMTLCIYLKSRVLAAPTF